MTYQVVDAKDVEPQGALRPVRRALGVKAFGINQLELPPGASGVEHDESASRQDEVYCVIAGSGTITVDGEEVELAPGRYVYVSAESVRRLQAGAEGLTCIVVGAPHERPYEPRGFF